MRRLAIVVAAALVVLAVGLPAKRAEASPCGLPGTPTSTVYLPNVTKTLGGPTGWVTPFIVQNVGASATTLEVSFYGFSDGALVVCRVVAGLLPGTSFADVPNNDADLPDGGQFAVVVRSFGSEVVAVVNEQQGTGTRAEGLSYVGLAQGSTTVGLPYVAKAVGGWTTTIVIQDLGASPATVSAAFSTSTGATATLTRTVAAGGSQFIDPGAEAALASGAEYSVMLTSSQPIAAVVNAHNDAAVVPAPRGFSYNGIAPPSAASVYLPYVARAADGARTTRVLVQNLGAKSATPTLTFRDAAGRQAVVTAPAAVQPGRVWSFDPRYLANGTSACPAAGTSTCVGTGQHGLVVTGGTFGAIGVTLNETTAIGMASMAAATQRVYLPNLTRTLGGASGWTTPIVLESAGATSAVLRWYRFADGTLAVTQYVGGLVKGAPVRIDPRDLSGLQDATQYAVVVDAAGGAVAAVLELNDLGGDGAMAYEGFAASGAVGAVPAPRSIALSPASASVGLSATQQFTATVTDTAGNAMVGVPLTWSVSPATIGTVSADGLFTASASAGSGTVTAKFGSISASAAVVVSRTATSDQPDDVTGPQIHVLYAIPNDGRDRLLDVDGTLARSVRSFEQWLSQQTGGRTLRLDTFHGAVDVSFVRLSRSDSAMRALDPFIVTNIGAEISESGFSDVNKIYIVYYDGSSAYSCGGAQWPGRYVAMYLHGKDVRGGPACDSNSFTSDIAHPGYWEFAMLHDTMHALGAAASCAPHFNGSGHVSDDRHDLMYSGSEPWGIDRMVLDVGRDDYYAHSDPNCLDVEDSPYLQ